VELLRRLTLPGAHPVASLAVVTAVAAGFVATGTGVDNAVVHAIVDFGLAPIAARALVDIDFEVDIGGVGIKVAQ
jgi:hypothetical protein